MHLHRLQAMDWTGAELITRLRAAMRLARTTYEQRGLDVRYYQHPAGRCRRRVPV